MSTKTNTYDCKYCKREYREKFNYDRHLQCCEFTFKSRREQNNEIDLLAPLPSPHEMYRFVQHLSCRIDKLEKENKRLNQVAQKKQNVLELMNSPETLENMELTFSEWIKQNILVDVPKYLQTVYDDDLLSGLKSVISSAINKFDIARLPIRTFDNSTSFYIFKSDENKVNRWTKINVNDLDKYLRRISNQFAYDFKEHWYDIHKEKVETDETYNDMYLDYYGKIIGGKRMSEETRFHKIRKQIFDMVKQTPKTVIEYVDMA